MLRLRICVLPRIPSWYLLKLRSAGKNLVFASFVISNHLTSTTCRLMTLTAWGKLGCQNEAHKMTTQCNVIELCCECSVQSVVLSGPMTVDRNCSHKQKDEAVILCRIINLKISLFLSCEPYNMEPAALHSGLKIVYIYKVHNQLWNKVCQLLTHWMALNGNYAHGTAHGWNDSSAMYIQI
jgi:hypothetical protein